MTPGSIIAGRYRIEQELGHGGMGAVYRATHLELGRQVALKMVLPDVIGLDQGLARFRREAELAQKLEHPNTVRLYDYGQTDEGLPYIAFELLRGMPLSQAIHQSGPMPPARVVRIITQVLKSLMEAHHNSIIHRDIKPPNIFLCEFPGEEDFVKVLDFGIAKSTNNKTLLTQTGLMIGTPNYMSPEMVRGDTLTPAADLYAVGLLIAEMLTGRMVLSGETTDILREHLSPHPVPLPQSLSRSPLWPVLLRATEKDVSRRYGSAQEMLRELEAAGRAAETSPYTSFRPPPDPMSEARTVAAVVARPVAPRRTNATPFVIAAVAVLLLGAGAGIALTMRSSDDQAKTKANEDDDDAPKKKKKPKPVVDEDEPVASKGMKGKLEKLGWKIVSESTTKQPNVAAVTYVAQKASQTVSLYVYEADDETILKSMETSLSAKGSATKRDGRKLYWLLTIPADKTLADDLLDELTR